MILVEKARAGRQLFQIQGRYASFGQRMRQTGLGLVVPCGTGSLLTPVDLPGLLTAGGQLAGSWRPTGTAYAIPEPHHGSPSRGLDRGFAHQILHLDRAENLSLAHGGRRHRTFDSARDLDLATLSNAHHYALFTSEIATSRHRQPCSRLYIRRQCCPPRYVLLPVSISHTFFTHQQTLTAIFIAIFTPRFTA